MNPISEKKPNIGNSKLKIGKRTLKSEKRDEEKTLRIVRVRIFPISQIEDRRENIPNFTNTTTLEKTPI